MNVFPLHQKLPSLTAIFSSFWGVVGVGTEHLPSSYCDIKSVIPQYLKKDTTCLSHPRFNTFPQSLPIHNSSTSIVFVTIPIGFWTESVHPSSPSRPPPFWRYEHTPIPSMMKSSSLNNKKKERKNQCRCACDIRIERHDGETFECKENRMQHKGELSRTFELERVRRSMDFS